MDCDSKTKDKIGFNAGNGKIPNSITQKSSQLSQLLADRLKENSFNQKSLLGGGGGGGKFTLPKLLQKKEDPVEITRSQNELETKHGTDSIKETLKNLKLEDDTNNSIQNESLLIDSTQNQLKLEDNLNTTTPVKITNIPENTECIAADSDPPLELSPICNEFCQLNARHIRFQYYFKEPSSLGRIFCKATKKHRLPSYGRMMPYEFLDLKSKHEIKPFQFDNLSPDDKILLALRKGGSRVRIE